LSSGEATRIAQEIRDLTVIRTRCPIGFAPFAEEVEGNIRPIFHADQGDQPDS
jgi:hypothetical protein